MLNRRFFQLVNGVVAAATLALGAIQLALGTESPMYGSAGIARAPSLDSNLRFFGGMAVVLGVMMLWALPNVEERRQAVVVFWGAALVGGLGRLVSAFVVGAPSAVMVGFAAIEVVVAPLVLVWHTRTIARTGGT